MTHAPKVMKTRLARLLQTLSEGLIERDVPARLALLCALSGEHLLLIGAPGTAKSVLARRLHRLFRDAPYFERLLTKFSVPEELFGPLSIKALEEDRYQRLTDRYLPSAGIAFVDEIFKANSAILNALLTLLNEREFDNGDRRVKVPLISVIGASNELPGEDELGALYDRFLCRYVVEPVSDARFGELLSLPEPCAVQPPEGDALDMDTVARIQREAEAVSLPVEVMELLRVLREFLRDHHLSVSDRRWRKIVKLLKVAAWTNGADTVTPWDCWLLQHCLWRAPEQRGLIHEWYQAHMGIGSGFNPGRLEKLVETWERASQEEAESRRPRRNDRGEPLYRDRNGNPTPNRESREWLHRDGEPLFLAPPDQADRTNEGRGYTTAELKARFFDDLYQQTHINGRWEHIADYLAHPGNRLILCEANAPCFEPAVQSGRFIAGRLKETRAIRRDIEAVRDALQRQAASVARVLDDHLWLVPEFAETAAASLSGAQALADGLSRRMGTVIDRYEKMPRRSA